MLPAMGFGDAQLADLRATIDRAECDAVVLGTPMDLGRLVETRHPMRRARYAYADAGTPTLADVLAPLVEKWSGS